MARLSNDELKALTDSEMRQELTQASLRKYLSYDAATGVFIRVVGMRGPRASAGCIAGSVRKDGYRRMKFAGADQYAHRLAWLYVTGALPAEHIDHIDGNPSNNAFSNLREATNSENMQNNRTSKGVSIHKNSGLWRCRLNVRGRTVVTTYHKTQSEAGLAYLAAKRLHHPYAVF